MSLQLIRRYTPPYSKILPGYQETSIPIHHDPRTGIFAAGEFSEFEPDWGNWYWNIKEYARVNKQLKSAGVNTETDMEAKLAGVNPQLEGKAHELMEAIDRAKAYSDKNYMKYVKSAAILKREDFQAFKTIIAQTKILAAKPRRHIILDMITVDNVSDFNTKIYTFDGPWDVVQENLPELNIPNITGFPNFTPLTLGMERFGIHYAESEEFIAEQFDINIRQFVVNNIAGQMETVFNKKVADVLNNDSTFTPYGDWKALTGTLSTRDPSEDINAEATKLDNTQMNEGIIIGSNRKQYNTYLSNFYNSGYGTPTYKHADYSFGNAIVTNIPHFIGLDWGIDSFFAANKMVLFDPAAIYAAQMPERIVDYKSQYGTHSGTIIRRNFKCAPIDTSRLLGLSGITV